MAPFWRALLKGLSGGAPCSDSPSPVLQKALLCSASIQTYMTSLLYRASSTTCSTSCPSFTAAANLTGKLPLHLDLAQTAWEGLGSELADLPQSCCCSSCSCLQPGCWMATRRKQEELSFTAEEAQLSTQQTPCYLLKVCMAVTLPQSGLAC